MVPLSFFYFKKLPFLKNDFKYFTLERKRFEIPLGKSCTGDGVSVPFPGSGLGLIKTEPVAEISWEGVHSDTVLTY